jgi:ankyrin repeat protein
MLMHLSCDEDYYPALEELFRYCEEHGIDFEVNDKDVNGDRALEMAMMYCNLPAVKLLLSKDAGIFDNALDHTTVLMKPFFDTVKPSMQRQGPRENYFGYNRDAEASACLQVVFDAVLSGSSRYRNLDDDDSETTSSSGTENELEELEEVKRAAKIRRVCDE